MFRLYFLNSVKQYEWSLDAAYISNLVTVSNVAISDKDSLTFVMTSVQLFTIGMYRLL